MIIPLSPHLYYTGSSVVIVFYIALVMATVAMDPLNILTIYNPNPVTNIENRKRNEYQ